MQIQNLTQEQIEAVCDRIYESEWECGDAQKDLARILAQIFYSVHTDGGLSPYELYEQFALADYIEEIED